MSKTFCEAKKQKYRYWKNKPVMKLEEKTYKSEQIKPSKDLFDKYYSENFVKLPLGYEWQIVDLQEQENMLKISEFITKYYRRGTESQYIIQYDPERLRWEMGIQKNSKGKCGFFMIIKNNVDNSLNIVGIIGITYRTVQIFADQVVMTEPMYMCCDKKYRKTGIAKVLMDEAVRQSLMCDIDKGIFCNNQIVPSPVATLRQYSRPINYKKLRENDFVDMGGVDIESVHNKTNINLRPNKKYVLAKKSDQNINIVHELYNKYMKSFNLHMVMTISDIENYFFDNKYVKTFLIMNNDDLTLPVDFISYNFYDLKNTEKTENNIITCANILMYSSNETQPDLLFINILKQLSADKIQIVYVTDMMHSNEFILSSVKNADSDTDDNEENALYDMNIMKTGKKFFINLFNWKCQSLTQNMLSWLIF